MSTHSEQQSELALRTRGRWVISLSILAALPIVVLSLGSGLYPIDLAISGFSWLWCTTIVILLALTLRTRRRAVLATLLIAVLCAHPIVASRVLWVPKTVTARDAEDVSIVVFNSDMNNETVGEIGPFVYSLDADVIVVIEPVWEFYRSVRIRDEIHPVYSNIAERMNEDDAPRFLVFSRWPMTAIDEEPLLNSDGIVRIVHRPDEKGGSFVIVAAHPPSPRDRDRWARGNASIERIADRVGDLVEAGNRVVFAADLNAAPGSKRDRILRRSSGTKRSKPIIGAWGSYPDAWSIARIAIDDLWRSPGIRVRSWETIRAPGSDHRAVRALLHVSEQGENP